MITVPCRHIFLRERLSVLRIFGRAPGRRKGSIRDFRRHGNSGMHLPFTVSSNHAPSPKVPVSLIVIPARASISAERNSTRPPFVPDCFKNIVCLLWSGIPSLSAMMITRSSHFCLQVITIRFTCPHEVTAFSKRGKNLLQRGSA